MLFRYQNRNPFPIYLPGKRGGSILFKPGEWSNDSWFSRFVARKKLSRVPVGKDKVKQGVPLPAGKLDSKTILGAVQEETKDYLKRGGMYFCKHCDIFRTGSIKAFTIHMKEYHKIPDNVTVTREEVSSPVVHSPVAKVIQKEPEGEKVVQKEPEGETVVRTSLKSRVPVEKKEEVLIGVNPSSNVDGTKLESDDNVVKNVGVFTCPIEGKQFSTQKGLNLHMTRVHGGK